VNTYRTAAAPSAEILYKEKNSKFFGCVFPISSETDVKPIIEQLRKRHPGAGHFCYAWQLGAETPNHRANDDGEPSGTAGLPIFGQVQSFRLTNVLIVVVRFFGGVKLGAGGLISAYRTAAQMAIEATEIIEKTIDFHYRISCSYADMPKVMRLIKEKNLEITRQQLELSCEIEVSVPKAGVGAMLKAFEALYAVKVSAI